MARITPRQLQERLSLEENDIVPVWPSEYGVLPQRATIARLREKIFSKVRAEYGIDEFDLSTKIKWLSPEDFGAPANGIDYDDEGITRMFAEAPNPAFIRFSPYKTYRCHGQSRPYQVPGYEYKSIVVNAYGSTIKQGYNGRYNFLALFGGPQGTETEFAPFCYWFGGVLDGFNEGQQYYPAVFGSYPSSTVGDLWNEGTSNSGLLSLRYFNQIVVRDLFVKNLVRDGVVCTNFDQAIFYNFFGKGAIPFNWHEMAASGQDPREAAYIKTRLDGNADRYFNKTPKQIIIDKAYGDTGCMFYFHRTNSKGGQEAADITLQNIRTFRMARHNLWIETADSLKVDSCWLHGEYNPNNTNERGDNGGLMIGVGVRYADIFRTVIRNGKLDFNTASTRIEFRVKDVDILRTSNFDSGETIINATHIESTTIRNFGNGGGIIGARYIGPGTKILQGGSVILGNGALVNGLELGRIMLDYDDVIVTAPAGGQNIFPLWDIDPNIHSIVEVFFRAPGLGPELVGRSRFSFNENTGVFSTSTAIKLEEGDQYIIRCVKKRVDTFEASSETTFVTSGRASSILSVTVGGSSASYTATRNSNNTLQITLSTPANNQDVVISWLPWFRQIVGGLSVGRGSTLTDVKAYCYSTVRMRHAEGTINNPDFRHSFGDGAVNLVDATCPNLKINGGRIGLCESTAINIGNNHLNYGTVEVNGTDLYDYGLDNSKVDSLRAAIGGALGANGKELLLSGLKLRNSGEIIGASKIGLITRANSLDLLQLNFLIATGLDETPHTFGTLRSGGKTILNGGYYGSGTFSRPTLANGASATTTITVNGAEPGDRIVSVTTLADLSGMHLYGLQVTALNTVLVRIDNNTGVEVAGGNTSINVVVEKAIRKMG